MKRAVSRGLARREQEAIPYLGIDETSFQKRHQYVTVVCDLHNPKVLYVSDGPGSKSIETITEQQREDPGRGNEHVGAVHPLDACVRAGR